MSNAGTPAQAPTKQAAWWRRYPSTAAVVLALVIAGGFWFLLLHTNQNYQELYNIKLATAPVHSIASQGSPDDPMPLYYLLLHGYSLLIGGVTLLSARILSLVFLVLSIPLCYAVGKRMSGNPAVGRLAALLLAASPFVAWFNSRATMYGLLLLLTLLNQYFFDALLQRERWWHWPGYIVSGLLGLGVHYFFGLILLLQLIFILVKHRHYRVQKLWLMIGCQLLFAAVFVAWLRYSLADTTYWHYLPFTGKPSATNAFILYVQFLFGFQSVLATTLIIAFWPLLVIVALLAIQKYVRPSIGVQYAMWASLAPMIVAFAAGWASSKPLFLTSYLTVSVAPFLLFISWYFVAFELRTLVLARNALLVVMIAAFFVQLSNTSIALQQDYLGLTSVQSDP